MPRCVAVARLEVATVALLLVVTQAPTVHAIGGWSHVEMTPLAPLRPSSFVGSLHPEERLHDVQMRLRRSSVAAGAWLMAKKEQILTEEEIYAEKVRKFARSVDQVHSAAARNMPRRRHCT